MVPGSPAASGWPGSGPSGGAAMRLHRLRRLTLPGALLGNVHCGHFPARAIPSGMRKPLRGLRDIY